MTTEFESIEEPEVTDEITPEQTEEQKIEEEFESGLNDTLGIVQETPPVITPQLIAGMTEDELKEAIAKAKQFDDLSARLTKTHDTAFGKIGQLEQTIRELKAVAPAERTPFQKEQFAKLREYFDDDDLVAAFVEDFNSLNLGGGYAKAPEIDYETINKGVDDRLMSIEEKFEIKLLNTVHPDWKQLSIRDYDADGNPLYTEEFTAWKNTLTPADQELVLTTGDGSVLAKAFNSFKDWRNKKAQAAQDKQKRLDDAMRPSGFVGTQQTQVTDDDFEAGMKSVRGA